MIGGEVTQVAVRLLPMGLEFDVAVQSAIDATRVSAFSEVF